MCDSFSFSFSFPSSFSFIAPRRRTAIPFRFRQQSFRKPRDHNKDRDGENQNDKGIAIMNDPGGRPSARRSLRGHPVVGGNRQRDAAGGEVGDHFGIDLMFNLQHARLQRLGGVAGQHRHAALA